MYITVPLMLIVAMGKSCMWVWPRYSSWLHLEL